MTGQSAKQILERGYKCGRVAPVPPVAANMRKRGSDLPDLPFFVPDIISIFWNIQSIQNLVVHH
ncbi:MAG: hypothetical protein ACYDDV_07045 [Methanoregula sp.]